MSNVIYSIDTCSLIDAWRYYQNVPRFWSHLADLSGRGRLVVSDEVLKELSSPKHLCSWVDEHIMAAPLSASVIAVCQQSVLPHYDPNAFKNGNNAAELHGSPAGRGTHPGSDATVERHHGRVRLRRRGAAVATRSRRSRARGPGRSSSGWSRAAGP